MLAPVGPPVSGARGWLGLPVVLPGQAEVGGRRVGVSPAPPTSALAWRTGGGGGGGWRGLSSTAGHHLTSPARLTSSPSSRPEPGGVAGLTGAVLQPRPLSSLLPGLRVLLQGLQLGQGNDVTAARLVPNCLLAACIVVIEPEQE